MTLETVRRALRSPVRNVLVEAAGGCGKTYEASELAADLGRDLPEGSEVLLLAHTNAAVQEFIRRTRGAGARVRSTTIDAFCLDLLSPYAQRLALATPLRRWVGIGAGRIPFADLAPQAVNLLTRCPAVATMLAYRYPLVILDEHQDASVSQHAVVASFRNLGLCRIRIFGDPMQAIYEAQPGQTVAWDQLMREAGQVVSLDTPQRWEAQPELGDWIMDARSELRAGRCLPLAQAPGCVRVANVAGLGCVGFGHGNVAGIAPTVRAFTRSCARGTAAILSRHNNHVWGLHIASAGGYLLNEGAEFNDAYHLLERAGTHVGNPQQMAACLVDYVVSISTGLNSAKRAAILRALRPDRVDYGRQQLVRAFLTRFEPLYESSDLSTFCAIAGSIAARPPEWLAIRMPMGLRLLGQIRPTSSVDATECLDEVIARIKAGAAKLSRTVSTVHKAKGQEFDHVLIANFSDGHFGDDEMSRRIAYVALSRARKSITLLVPSQNPSPLLPAR